VSESTAVEEGNTDLSGLVELQRLDLRVRELGSIVASLPSRLEELEERLKSERQALTEAEGGLEESGHQSRLLEGEIQDLGEKRVKYKTQLMEVKTNDAYQAMIHEIGFVEQAISAKEDEVLQHMLEIDELKDKTATVRVAYESLEQQIAAERREVKTEAKQAEEALAKASQEREAIEAQVPPGLLSQYQRIAGARNGVALVGLEGDSCQACHVRLRPQVIATVRAGRGINRCENCNRILYDPTA